VEKLVAFVRSFSGGNVIVKEESKEPPTKPMEEPKIDIGPKKPPKELGPSAEEKAAQIRVATVIYREYCVNCHGKDGKGLELKVAMPEIPDFTGRRWQEAHTNPEVAAAIRTGKDKMPSFGEDRIQQDQLNALVAYVRAFGPERFQPPDKGTPSQFEERFRLLEEEWDALQKQLEELKKQPKKP
jgi:mono/diheme cytochrome c family protein